MPSPGGSSIGPGKLMKDRTKFSIIRDFFVVPWLIGPALLGAIIFNASHHAHEFSFADWFWQVGFMGLLSIGIMSAPPAAGWQELRRRSEKFETRST